MITRTWSPPFGETRRAWSSRLVIAPLLLAFGCATMADRGQSLVPTRYQVRTGPFLIYSNTPVPAESPAVRCLLSLETDLTTRLGYHSRPDEEPVEIYILNDRNAYTHFLKFYYPELPPRRAFFLAQGARRVVYTYLSDRLEDDLRHEATHALVRGCSGDLPLWLDEGIAEYFETRSDTIDVQDEHMAKIPEDLKKGWSPDLARLESLTDIHEMTPLDYRESWAWVHLMINGSAPGNSLLLDYLNRSRNGKRGESLSQILAARGMTGKTLIAHLERVQSRVVARKPEPPSRDRLIRFQDRGSESRERGSDFAIPWTPPPQRPSLLRRIGSWLGF